MKQYLINFFKFLLFLSIGSTILWLVYRSQNTAFIEECALNNVSTEECGTLFDKVVQDFREANYFWVLMALVAFTISNISRSLRWQMLLEPLGRKTRFSNAFLTIVLGYFANLGIPRSGEVVRAATFGQYERIGVEKVMGTVVVDRIFDVISILLVSGLTLLLEFENLIGLLNNLNQGNNTASTSNGPNWLLILAGIGALGMALLLIFRKRLIQTKFGQKVMNLLNGFVEGISTVRKLKTPWLFVLHSINIWLMYYMMTYLCFFAFAPTEHLSALAALTVFVVGGWGVVIPAPGGMGTYHLLVKAVLENLYGISGDDAFSFANITFFSIQIGSNVLIGLLSLLLLPVLNKNYSPEPC